MTWFAQLLHAPQARRHWRVVLALLLGVISWFAFAPHPPGMEFENADKVQHIFAFAALACVGSFVAQAGRRTAVRVFGWLLAYGFFIEAVQAFLPTRSADLADVVGDAIGIAAGLSLAAALRRWLQPPKR